MNPWKRVTGELREVADSIDRQAPLAFEVIQAARVALEALAAIQERDDGSLVSPARWRLAKALDDLDRS